MRVMRISSFFSIAVLAFATPAMAAFMVDVTGTGSANASSNGTASTSVPSSAFGIDGANSWFGGNVDPDTYTFSYTPGTDADNLVSPSGTSLGDVRVDAPSTFVPETLTASGVVGGDSGNYNVYITWPETQSSNAAGSIITITSDGGPIVLDPITMNSNENGPGAKGNNAWLKIASDVPLTALNSYTVTVEANAAAFVSQRVHGVLWEKQVVPEPTSVALIGLGGLGMILARRRRR